MCCNNSFLEKIGVLMTKEEVIKVLDSGVLLGKLIAIDFHDGLTDTGIKHMIDLCQSTQEEHRNIIIPDSDKKLIDMLADNIMKELNK